MIVTGDSFLNGINVRGLSKDQQVEIHNFTRRHKSETTLKEIEILVADKPDCIIIYAGTTDITNGTSSLNSGKKIAKKTKRTNFSKQKESFFKCSYQKKKRDLDKNVQGVNEKLSCLDKY